MSRGGALSWRWEHLSRAKVVAQSCVREREPLPEVSQKRLVLVSQGERIRSTSRRGLRPLGDARGTTGPNGRPRTCCLLARRYCKLFFTVALHQHERDPRDVFSFLLFGTKMWTTLGPKMVP